MDQPVPTVLAKKGAIKEEFDEMFHKLKIEEERTRLAEQQASEELAKRIMVCSVTVFFMFINGIILGSLNFIFLISGRRVRTRKTKKKKNRRN